MNNAVQHTMQARPALGATIERACRGIAPSWPLDRQIAVNPFWGLIDQPFEAVADELRRLDGSHFALAPEAYLEAWRTGTISPAALTRALAEHGSRLTADETVAALEATAPSPGLMLPSDLVDRSAPPSAGPRWCDVITQQVSQYCASYFDEHQADWHRGRTRGLYRDWRAALLVDHAVEPLKNAPEIHARAGALPDGPEAAIAWALERLGVPAEQAEDLLKVCLLRINGWASWCAYLAWQADLARSTDTHLQELLAIRICWEALLFDEHEHGAAANEVAGEVAASRRDETPHPGAAATMIWQRAHEIAYQDPLVRLLDRSPVRDRPEATGARASAQLIFCIDVRSERFRRALETVHPNAETRGFAGFFGLPIQYRPIGTHACRPQLPGLLAPSLEVTDSTGAVDRDQMIARRRARRLEASDALQPFQRLPSGAFSLVEAIGIGYAAKLLRRHFGGDLEALETLGLAAGDAGTLRPRLVVTGGEATARKAGLVASVLRAMGFTARFARLVILVGHGSQSANNPQAAGLDCGACGGQTGEVNARALAAILNEEPVRVALCELGIELPPDTVFVAALHNTTTDEVALFDTDAVPGSHRQELEYLARKLEAAGSETRAERAPDLGLGALVARPKALLKRVRLQARDWAETRPEWGLANNATFIVAPRARTRGLNLEGRSFLHDYASGDDPEGGILELIMTAPMVVTHWINLQYFASTVDPERYGSGNKVLHNVACGRIGIFEGNTGDLRVGLSRQSLHDGERWMHAPLRLSVFIDAPRERIEAVLRKHAVVRDLVANRWLYLFRFSDRGCEWHCSGLWQPWHPSPSAR
jgi:uncharacterized protein YbcC (UPF0753/DUF2309 family)